MYAKVSFAAAAMLARVSTVCACIQFDTHVVTARGLSGKGAGRLSDQSVAALVTIADKQRAAAQLVSLNVGGVLDTTTRNVDVSTGEYARDVQVRIFRVYTFPDAKLFPSGRHELAVDERGYFY